MNIGKFPKEFHRIVRGRTREKADGWTRGKGEDGGILWAMHDGWEEKGKGLQKGGREKKGGKGNPVFLLALVRAAESLRNRREPDKLAAKQAAISRNDGTPEARHFDTSDVLTGSSIELEIIVRGLKNFGNEDTTLE